MDDKKDLILELIKSNKISDARYEITKIEKSGSYEDHELLYYKGIVEKTDKNYSKAIDCFQGSLELVKPNVPLILFLSSELILSFPETVSLESTLSSTSDVYLVLDYFIDC